ncbi:hypothetical protein [Streptomyces sp. NPDC051921]|uniref:hypothetical protein n=1 Tax=Streptomyces sp. NPDC051921 TaxID=3155806 RepID=UPI003436E2AB
MDEAQLSPRERRILEEIEHDLDEDTALARTLATGHRPRFRGGRSGSGPGARSGRLTGHRALGAGRFTGLAALVLVPVALVLFVIAVATGSSVLIWTFAAVWVLTLTCVLRLLLRWSRRHLTGRERPRPDDGDVG